MSFIDPEKVILADKELDQQLICLICRGILINPNMCSDCNRHYCQKCISRLNPSRCPVCKNYKFNNHSQNITDNLNTLIFNTICCNIVLAYNDYESHINECQAAKYCLLCNNKIFILEEDEHQKVCSNREVTCNKCGKKIQFNEYLTHILECERSDLIPIEIQDRNIVQIYNNNVSQMCRYGLYNRLCYNRGIQECNRCNNIYCKDHIRTLDIITCFDKTWDKYMNCFIKRNCNCEIKFPYIYNNWPFDTKWRLGFYFFVIFYSGIGLFIDILIAGFLLLLRLLEFCFFAIAFYLRTILFYVMCYQYYYIRVYCLKNLNNKVCLGCFISP